MFVVTTIPSFFPLHVGLSCFSLSCFSLSCFSLSCFSLSCFSLSCLFLFFFWQLHSLTCLDLRPLVILPLWYLQACLMKSFVNCYKGCRGRYRMVVGFTTICAISAFHHYRCEYESHSCEVYSIQHYVKTFVSDLWQVGGFLWALWYPPPIKLSSTI
jgi:hypothetical protein